MHSAQQEPKHTAQLSVMQGAYASGVRITSRRHINRMLRLRELVAEPEVGGPARLALAARTPKQHMSALLSGARGLGDTLAAKLERAGGKSPGWLDMPVVEPSSDPPSVNEPSVAYEVVETVDLSDTDWAMLEAFQDFPPSMKQAKLDAILVERAAFTQLADEVIGQMTRAGKIAPVQPVIAPKPSGPPAKRARRVVKKAKE